MENKDLFLTFLTFIFLFITLQSCNKEEQEEIIKEKEVDYFLTEEQKSIIEVLRADTSIAFFNEELDSIRLSLVEIKNYLSYPESDTRTGESMTAFYLSETDYLPNFGIAYDLLALENDSAQMSITFGTGTYWHDRANDYNFSFFYLNPFENSGGSIFVSQEWIEFEYYEQLEIGNDNFSNVYYMANRTWTGTGFVVVDCYYQIEKGVIAFTDFNEKFWIIAK